MIPYDVGKSHLQTIEGDLYVPRTFANGSIDIHSVIRKLSKDQVGEGKTKDVLTKLYELLIEELSEGRTIHLDWCYLRPQIKGSFSSPLEPFTPGKHSIEVSITPSMEFLRELAIRAMPRKIDNPKSAPIPKEFNNDVSGTRDRVSSGDMCSIKGSYLKFDKTVPEEGVFFEAEGGIKIRVEKYSRITSKELIFLVPTGIENGTEYTVVVYSRFGSELRMGKLYNQIMGE